MRYALGAESVRDATVQYNRVGSVIDIEIKSIV